METLYTPEKLKEQLSLTEEQKDSIRSLTLGIQEVDDRVLSLAVEDVLHTLENGHPLNRLIIDQKGEIDGYLACEDFIPHEAYIKYFATTKQTSRNLFKEIPAFLEYAKQQGYTKINFHGWNERLNHILEHFGFEHLRTDNMAQFNVDFYEKTLIEQKSSEEIEKDRINAFEQKFLTKLKQEYEQTLATFSLDTRKEKENEINQMCNRLDRRLGTHEYFIYGDRQKAILKLKLARHFQNNTYIDENILFDAIIESPKFINTDKGSFHRLFEIHEEKTVQKIAEIRKQRAELKGSESFNPYEALFETTSGNYYMARLLNMPHLEKESEYMNHCVGTSDSYINKIKRGEIEILSFRNTPKLNTRTQKLEGDTPIITIEYNRKSKTIEQMKKYNDAYLNQSDPYYADVIDALKQLRATKTDTGELRDFSKINSSELENIPVEDESILTENGEIALKDFNPDENLVVLKIGAMDIGTETSREDIAKLVQMMTGARYSPEEIETNLVNITEKTKLYTGKVNSYNLSDVSYSDLDILLQNTNLRLFDTNSMKEVKIKHELPQTLDYEVLKENDSSKIGEVIVNPESVAIDWETISPEKIKSFDFAEFVGKPRSQLVAHIAKEYSGKYIIPDLTYREFLMNNPDKIPPFMKDGNWYYFYGSILRYSDGDALVPDVYWNGGRLNRNGSWLDHDWDGSGRVLLLEK